MGEIKEIIFKKYHKTLKCRNIQRPFEQKSSLPFTEIIIIGPHYILKIKSSIIYNLAIRGKKGKKEHEIAFIFQ